MSAAYTSEPALAWLCGARVQRVDGPSPGCFALTFFDRGDKSTLLLMLAPAVRGVGALRERPKGDAASGFVQRLRTSIEGSRLRAAAWLSAAGDARPGRAHALLLTFARGEQLQRIAVDFDTRGPNLFLLRADDTLAGAADERARRERFDKQAAYAPRAGSGIVCSADAASLFAAGEALLQTTSRRSDDGLRSRLQAQTRAQLKRAERKAEAIRGDLARAATAPQLRREGQLLLCSLHEVPRGASHVRLRDDAVEPAEYLDVKLDPAVDAKRNAEARFERARKLDRGVPIARGRLAEADAEVSRLRDLLARAESDDPQQVEGAAAEVGITQASVAQATRPPRKQERVAYRVFTSADGQRILVGKGAGDNDTLTLTVARPHDHWLHTRGSAGAHVVVPLERNAQIAPEVLLDAAHLAAHFSKLRGEPSAEIAHTARRFVRKPRGAAPGSVLVDRERVFVVRLEPARLQRLLASERT